MTDARQRFALWKNDQSLLDDVISFLELEITGFCQLKCKHCYADSSPESDHGTMSADGWERVIDEAHMLSVDTVQFIGGEPTLHPELPRLVRYALGKGLKVDVYTNLVHITLKLWELLSLPGVSLGTSWYSADPDRHADVTGSKGSHARTRANIVEALQRGIPIRVGIVDVVDGQDTIGARGELLALGVTDINIDRARGVGRAARGIPDVSELCGRCGRGRAAISLHGDLSPCVIGRFLVAGNVKDSSLRDILGGQRWSEIVGSIPAQGSCTPSDSDDCDPSREPRWTGGPTLSG
ncbi:MAG: radical SAM/SPASM domain-containing protein [Pseudonocardiaceae bacterium]